MKKKLITLPFAFLANITPAFADFGKVVDSDGYVNVRADASVHSKVIDTIHSGDFVYIFGDDFQSIQSKNWYCVDFGSDEKIGNIHKSRLQLLKSMQAIPYMSFDSADGNMAYLYWDGEHSTSSVEVSVKVEGFDFYAHQSDFEIVEHYGYKSAKSYKGKPFWGTDGVLPIDSKRYQHIQVTIDNKTISVPQSDLADLFGVEVESSKIYYNSKNNGVYITALNGNGAGAYEVLFAFENGKYIGKTVVIPF